MKNYLDGPGMPLGLGMALAQNLPAMERFAALSDDEKQAVIRSTHAIRSKQEMQAFVQRIAEGGKDWNISAGR